MQLLPPIKLKKVFYAKGIDMRFSFDKLMEVAEKALGADLATGDVVIFDNENGGKRKALQKTPKGVAIVYVRLDSKKDSFMPMGERDGLVQIGNRKVFA